MPLHALSAELQQQIFGYVVQDEVVRITAVRYQSAAFERAHCRFSFTSTSDRGLSSRDIRPNWRQALEDHLLAGAATIEVNVLNLTFNNFKEFLRDIEDRGLLPQFINTSAPPTPTPAPRSFKVWHFTDKSFPKTTRKLVSFNKHINTRLPNAASLNVTSEIAHCDKIEPLQTFSGDVCNGGEVQGSFWEDTVRIIREELAANDREERADMLDEWDDDRRGDAWAYQEMIEAQKRAAQDMEDAVGGAEVKEEEMGEDSISNNAQDVSANGPPPLYSTIYAFGGANQVQRSADPATNMIGFTMQPPVPGQSLADILQQGHFRGNFGHRR